MSKQTFEEAKPLPRSTVREIILEDFMSYEYARIPLRCGVNLVCGPNGAGKSSILIALSLALGQTHTERSRRLSDLVRYGRSAARVTLLINNSPVKGRRPISISSSDLFQLSRYIRKDGTYWYEGDFKEVTKSEVDRVFQSLGINPNNVLIIMHQNMVEEFTVVSAEQKLRMVEDAVGFQSYREHILEAEERLSKLLSEQDAVASLLTNAERTLEYWKVEYEKLLRRKELTSKREALEREYVWSQVIQLEKEMAKSLEAIGRAESRLNKIATQLEKIDADIEEGKRSVNSLREEYKKSFYQLVALERQQAHYDAFNEIEKGFLKDFTQALAKFDELMTNFSSNPKSRNIIAPMLHKLLDEFKVKAKDAKRLAEIAGKDIFKIRSALLSVEEKSVKVQEEFIESRVQKATLELRRDLLQDDLESLQREKSRLEKDIAKATEAAREKGPRINTARTMVEISNDSQLTTAYLAAIGEIAEDTERMYNTYVNLYDELKQKSAVVAENRKKALREIEIRKETWRRILSEFLEEINKSYDAIISKIDGRGLVQLSNVQDVDSAGLEIRVGFHGVPPVILDSYAQSGGERTVAIMAFLLALQQHVKSPIRGLDEFDVHMDPRNRLLTTQLITEASKTQENVQYIVITPSQIPIVDDAFHIITVQNTAGKSVVGTGA